MKARLPSFAKRLLDWWQLHGRHDLPWQHPRSAYRVWVSEIMLQQTQVATVIPYFERFMARFPDLPALASAPLDEVLGLWSGLGYYARARNLHQAAVQCMQVHGGALPRTAAALASLPGIGISTANAIVSQSQDLPAAVLDGNVRRVLARHAAIPGWPGTASVREELWREAERRLPPNRGADYSQAIMDLGATLCTRSRPRCQDCPVRADCQALAIGDPTAFPGKSPQRLMRAQSLHVLLSYRDDGAVLLERRPPSGIWGGLWCLPAAANAEILVGRFGLAAVELAPMPAFSHQLTHLRLDIQPHLSTVAPRFKGIESDASLAWYQASEYCELGLPAPVRKLLKAELAEPRLSEPDTMADIRASIREVPA